MLPLVAVEGDAANGAFAGVMKLDEALPHPQLQGVRAATERLLRTWAGLWALHGDAPAAKPVYPRLFDDDLAAVRVAGATIQLANGTRWIDGVTMMHSRSAVRTPMQRGMAPAMA